MEYDRPQGRVWTKARSESCVGRLGRARGRAGQHDHLGVASGHFSGNVDRDLVGFGNGDAHSVSLHVRILDPFAEATQGFCQGRRVRASPKVGRHLAWGETGRHRRHIANAMLRGRIEAICRAAGYEPPVICTPLELVEE